MFVWDGRDAKWTVGDLGGRSKFQVSIQGEGLLVRQYEPEGYYAELRGELRKEEKSNLESLDLAKFTTINHIHTCKKRRVTL